MVRNPVRLFSVLSCVILSLSAVADVIHLRDGSEIPCTIRLVNDTDVKYNVPKNDQQMSVPTSDVYMLKFNSRGNVYISSDGKRVTGENQVLPRGVDVVYLIAGQECPAYRLSVDSEKISFLPNKPSKKQIPMAMSIPRDEVFKIVYADGTIDIITRLDMPVESPAEASPATQAEYKAVIHTVDGKETIGDIAARYGVGIDEIKEWNSLDSGLSPNTKFLEGRQLMIYVLPVGNK